MKALAALGYGDVHDLVFIDQPIPLAEAGQIQVRIAAVSINPTDVRVIAGAYKDMVPIEFPYIPGNDFAGTVTDIGLGVTQYKIGDEVFGQALPRQLRAVASPDRPSISTGAMAEYAVFEANTALLARRPDSVPVDQAAALGIAGMTARAIEKIAAMKPGQIAFVIGATGGVGTALLPLLSNAGIHTIATARSQEGRDLLARLGATEIVSGDPANYPMNVDAVFNLALFSDDIGAAAKSLRSGGKMITIMFPAASLDDLGRTDVELHSLMDMEGEYGGMHDVAAAAASGRLTVAIKDVFVFEDAIDAMVAYAHSKALGKIVVTFPR